MARQATALFLALLTTAGAAQRTAGPELSGSLTPVHDPAIIRQGDEFLLFVTGHLGPGPGPLALRTSPDLVHWTLRGASFPELPSWAARLVPGAKGLWAPDISRVGGEYRLYYAVSTFGSNRSAIGLATARKIDPEHPAAGWTDKGPVIASTPTNDYNAIDPAAFVDVDGRHWMAFGSFWSGIKLIELDPKTGLRKAGDPAPRAIAARPELGQQPGPGPGALEAPFVIRRGGYYYLFVSFDFCCRGKESSYNTVVGRARTPEGPYVDRTGRAMLRGGGTPVLASGRGGGDRFVGRGHVAVLQDGGRDRIVYHAYDTQANGTPTLRIQPLKWTRDGWPVAA
ncbi:arabinan endo-1,5-alpha-L-arabinosidase [Sphingomonas aerophila]|uniref:Extracellular exo-alpha-(1->5)-L-arabinofuranosidase n=1 Tax=Sphingomonas aerophila TaxID=1344948 RepID=A0A7W9BDN0_9SPHN|nr:arabinan endo-1,5-alpha-L-arabinosidase [Sphingomonas aerophila]MBB5715078.1 arabinan endo-1,5-alpha-L-arabinosidase [Sphingomonas aerophila]